MGKKNKKRKAPANRKPSRTQSVIKKNPSSISLCMIVKNEAHFLADCLKSVRELVDEIIIVDTGSADKTVDIALDHAAKVFHYEWKKDFAAARNFALSKTTCPWILYLDADERLHKPYHNTVLKAVRSGDADVYQLKVRSNESGVLGKDYHDMPYPRLFRKLDGVQFEGKVHEQIAPSLMRAGARFRNLDVIIQHLGYAQDADIIRKKIERNLDLLREELKNNPNNAYAHFQLGRTYILMKEQARGIDHLKTAIGFNILPVNIVSSALLIIAEELYKSGDYDEALQFVSDSLKIAHSQRAGYFLASECHAKKGNWQEAIRHLEMLRKNADIPFSELSSDKDFSTQTIEVRLTLYHYALKDFASAFEHGIIYFKTADKFLSSLLEKWVFSIQNIDWPADRISEMLNFFADKMDHFDHPTSAIKLLAGLATKLNDRALAGRFLDWGVNNQYADEIILDNLGTLALEESNLSAAEDLFLKALEKNTHIWDTHYKLAAVYIKSREFQKAIEVLQKALGLFPEYSARIRKLLGGLYTKTGQLEKVIEYCSTVS